MLALTSSQKVMWITLLCLVSSSEEEGIIRNITEERLKLLSGILPNDPISDEWKETDDTLDHFKKLKMIELNGENVTILNFAKRQTPQDSYDPDAVKERVKRFRNKGKSLHETERNDRVEETRVEKKKEDILKKK